MTPLQYFFLLADLDIRYVPNSELQACFPTLHLRLINDCFSHNSKAVKLYN